MRKTKGNSNKKFRYVALVLLIVFLIAGVLLFLEIWDRQNDRFPDQDAKETTVSFNGKEYVPKEDTETFLLMGLDKFEGAYEADSYNNDRQADFLMLFVYDNSAETVTAIHINRDTMANVNILGVNGNKVDTVVKQIALAHTYGNGKDVSCRNTADSVSDLLFGIKVDHYMSLTMDSVAVFNDLVGGVEVTVLDDFSGIDDTLIKGESVTLTGEHALNYVRTRYGLEDSSNSTRMVRQQQYINALYDKTTECIANDEDFIVEATLKMSDYLISDRSVTQLQEKAKKLTEYDFNGIREIKGESKVGEQFVEFYADDASIKETVIDLFYIPKD